MYKESYAIESKIAEAIHEFEKHSASEYGLGTKQYGKIIQLLKSHRFQIDLLSDCGRAIVENDTHKIKMLFSKYHSYITDTAILALRPNLILAVIVSNAIAMGKGSIDSDGVFHFTLPDTPED